LYFEVYIIQITLRSYNALQNGVKKMNKLDRLQQYIGKYSSAVIAFSGGVDSTFLAKVATGIFKDRLLLVTATSSTYPESELNESRQLAVQLGIKQQVIISEEIDIDGFADNPPDRCYFCKRELFSKIVEIAKQGGYEAVFDGSNADDLKDWRPGRKALKELGILSPLCETGLTKNEIREYSAALKLPTAKKASFACLASRFPYGEKITKEKLDRVGKAEEAIQRLGFTQFRVRSHGDLARIEIAPEELDRAWPMRTEFISICKDSGYTYVALDLEGYRTGAMNEVLPR